MTATTDDPTAPATTVLVVDPDRSVRSEVGGWLRDAGYALLEAATFEEARRVLASAAPDVLVAGLRLGAFNGLHLVISARAKRPSLRAVLVTSIDDAAVADEARRVGAAYIRRPVGRGALLEAIAGP